jgi:mono/diheme cytochrome c family protein
MICLLPVTAVVLGLAAAVAQAQKPPVRDIPANILEIFKKNCTGCHTGQRPPKGLSLIPSKVALAIDAPSTEMPKLKIIDSAEPESSYLLKKIEGASDIQGARMPRGRHMADADRETLKAWILGLKAKSPSS